MSVTLKVYITFMRKHGGAVICSGFETALCV